MFASLEVPVLIASVLGVGALFGMLFLWLLGRQDHRTWVLARAPKLPIRALAVGDDAWIRGVVRCDAPLSCPWFDVPCIAFSYSIERKVTRTRKDADGKTHTETTWETEHSESDACDFEVDDGTAAIVVRMEKAKNEAMKGLGTDYEWSDRRHSARIVELGAEVSALGVVADDRSFGRRDEVPLLLTRQESQSRVRSSHRSEAVLFFFACFLPMIAGGAAAVAVLGPGWHDGVGRGFAIAAAAVGTALPFWWLGTHNRFVRLRQMVQAAFRQVDVDLAVRSGLVPNLVAVVQTAAAHERDLLADLARIRSGGSAEQATAGEHGAAAAARQVLLLHERYPALKTDAVYRDLHERLWAVEEKLAHSRQLYNDVVTEWNDRTQRFPAVLVARLCGYRQAPLFAGDDQDVPPPLRDRDA